MFVEIFRKPSEFDVVSYCEAACSHLHGQRVQLSEGLAFSILFKVYFWAGWYTQYDFIDGRTRN